MNDTTSLVVGTALLTLTLAVLAVSIVAAPIVGGVGLVIWGVYRYVNSPSQLEERAKAQAQELYKKALELLGTPMSKEEFGKAVYNRLPHMNEAIVNELLYVVLSVYDIENFTVVPPPPPVCNSIEGARYRDEMSALLARMSSPHTAQIAAEALAVGFTRFVNELPALPEKGDLATIPLAQMVPNLPDLVETLALTFYGTDATRAGLFVRMREQLDRNLCELSGLPFTHANRESPDLIMAKDYKGDDPVWDYLKGTPLTDVFDAAIPFGIPDQLRFEHHHVVGGSGHGKTQTLQYLISKDLEKDCSIVVIDSQNQLIPKIANLDIDPERYCIIDVDDVEYPVCLNLFDVGLDRIEGYSPLERERMMNGVIELYDYVFGSLLGAGMTSKQETAFRFVTRLMMHIPEATIHTLMEVFQKDGLDTYREYIDKLPPVARSFFETEYEGREFIQTRQQVLRRLYAVLENATFERMFANPRSKLDLFKEINEGKIILIKTSKATMKQTGTEILGRFFIAMIGMAIQERATLKHKKPCYIYIDECQDYIEGADVTITNILEQARKQNVGTIWAHQYLGQLDPKMQQCFAANSSLKFAGGVSAQDARIFASQMRCDQSLVDNVSKGTFASYIKGMGTFPLSFPFGHMEDMPKRSDNRQLRDLMRERYATKYKPSKRPVKDVADEASPSNEPSGNITDATDTW